MKTKNILFLTFLAVGIIACNNTESVDNIETVDTTAVLIDTTAITIDTTSVLPDSLQELGYVDEKEETNNIIEQKYGKQWDFCDCAVKNDSINKAIETAGDEEFDAIFARMDVIESHCKELLTAPNTTPEERSKHRRKIRKCLKEAGIK
jgi:hypothetical protein